ncbi:hypothetical protein DFH28DRAFT_920953 [Melampsora americana]|nr:hypothetical protein DFH28DRAFT_920953 [Melampsora americana]
MMVTKSLLSIYLIILSIFSLLYSLPTEEHLLESCSKRLSNPKEVKPETILSKDALKEFQTGTGDEIIKNEKIETLKRDFSGSFKGETVYHNERSTPWEVYYGVSRKVLRSSTSPMIKNLAEAVQQLGLRLRNDKDPSGLKTNEIKKTIKLARDSLQDEALHESERLWSLGLLSFLNSRISISTPEVWKPKHLSRPQEDFQLFLLKEQDLKSIVQEMWSKSPPRDMPTESVSEALQRDSLVQLIKKDFRMNSKPVSKGFDEIFFAFMNLKSPISPDRLLILEDWILSYLQLIIKKNVSNEVLQKAKRVVQILFHLDEHHLIPHSDFKALIRFNKIRPIFLEGDIEIQISDKKLPSSFKTLLSKFKNLKELNGSQLPEILKLLTHKSISEISDLQLRRFIRVLETVFESNADLFRDVNLQIHDDVNIISKRPEMVQDLPQTNKLKHLPGMNQENF